MSDHSEGASIHEGVSREIKHRRRHAFVTVRGDRYQYIAGMSDGAIGEQPLDVGLLSAAKLPTIMWPERRPEQWPPSIRDGAERGNVDADEHGESGGFRTGGHEHGDRRGSPLIDIRGPYLKRRGGDLESETDEHQRRGHASQQRRVAGIGVGEEAADRFEIGGAGDAVDPGNAVEKKRRGEGAEQEILDGGLIVALIVAKISGEI